LPAAGRGRRNWSRSSLVTSVRSAGQCPGYGRASSCNRASGQPVPSDEFKEVIDRGFSKAAARQAIDLAETLLREVVNHASAAFRRCIAEIGPEEDLHIAPFYLYRHVVEQIDGVQVLLSEACATASIPVIRTAFEACLHLEFILQERQKFERRSYCWWCDHLRSELSTYERVDPDTKSGQEFWAAWVSQIGEAIELPPDLLRGAKDSIRRRLALPHLQEANEELDRLSRSNRKPSPRRKVPWFAAYGGPSNRRELARILKRLAEYDRLYRYWSSVVHGEDADLYLITLADYRGAFRPVRDPKDLPRIASLAVALMLRATRSMVTFYRPGEDLAPWYKREIQGPWKQLQAMRIEIRYRPKAL